MSGTRACVAASPAGSRNDATSMSHPHDDLDHVDLPPPMVEEVRDGIYAYVQLDGSWGLNNSGFLAGRDGTTLIDTCFTERRTRALLDTVRAISDRPIRTLVNTHHHGDHTHGNHLLPGATIIGHDRCRDEVLSSGHIAKSLFPGVDWGRLEVAAPFVTFDEHLTVWVDERRIELRFAGPAHTTNDVIGWIPDERVLFAGDLVFNGGTPFVVMGSVSGTLAAVDRLRGLDSLTIVPGHGPVCGPEALDAQSDYLRFVQTTARRGFAAGTPPLDLAFDTDLGPFAELHDPERLVGNLYRAYSELRGEPLGSPIDVQAYADMITFNGGQPLRCLA
jgi:cyclase